ncbi:hypothetical protein P780_16625 [Vibrio mimicus CAIM 1882]|nr:hypothetical protein P780_16625 [Vibrio mimicus CAIM 1882]
MYIDDLWPSMLSFALLKIQLIGFLVIFVYKMIG